MYGNSIEASLLRQAYYHRNDTVKLLSEGNYAAVSKKLSLANECERIAEEPLNDKEVMKALHFFLLAQGD